MRFKDGLPDGARLGARSGDGGLVETSGKQTLEFSRAADVSAPRGEAGTWLLDPEDIDIDGGLSNSKDILYVN